MVYFETRNPGSIKGPLWWGGREEGAGEFIRTFQSHLDPPLVITLKVLVLHVVYVQAPP